MRELLPLQTLLSGLSHKFQIDLLLIDGNGQFHKRGYFDFLNSNDQLLGCGLACQVGYSSGIPSIGVAKNFGGSGLHFLGVQSEKIAGQLKNVRKSL